MNTVEEFLNANLLEWIERVATKASDTECTRFVRAPQIGMSGMLEWVL